MDRIPALEGGGHGQGDLPRPFKLQFCGWTSSVAWATPTLIYQMCPFSIILLGSINPSIQPLIHHIKQLQGEQERHRKL